MSDYKILVNSYDDYTLAVEVGRLANNLEELKMKISNVKKENGNTEITFSDGHKINIKDGDTPTIDKNGFWIIGGQSTGVKARAELSFKELSPQEKLSIKGDKGDPLRWEDLTYEQKASLKGDKGDTGEASRVIESKVDNDGNTLITFNDKSTAKINRGPKGDKGDKGDKGNKGDTGEASRVLKTDYDSEGNTLITFNDQTTAKINRGKTGLKGDKGDSTTTSSITKSGLTTTVKFTDGKSMQIEDGMSVNVSSSKILDDGNTEITFSDGKKVIVKKGQDGSVKFDELTEEQKKSLQVDVVDDLTTGGSNKALSAEQGKNLLNIIAKYHPDVIPPKIMTAVIDQSNSNPLTCITYEDDAKMMEKGSPEWDDFFQSQLVLFKDGKEVRELEDSELNDLKPEDGDVMVRFPRKGLRIKTVGEKVYVSMTNKTNDPDFKYYAHSRGDSPRDAFYIGAYLGYEESGKLRSITNVEPVTNKGFISFRQLVHAVGDGYEISGFYQLTFLQAMYVLKYGNLDSQTAIGKGLTNNDNSIINTTGQTNSIGIDYGTQSSIERMRFQYLEDFWGNKFWLIDGIYSDEKYALFTTTDGFDDSNNNYLDTGEKGAGKSGYLSEVFGTSELGFVGKTFNGSSSSYYCDHYSVSSSRQMFFGGSNRSDTQAGAFNCILNFTERKSNVLISARLMFL